ncbi:MAG: zinc ABC transporter substrate-binding protein [Pseudomonadota bacterium]
MLTRRALLGTAAGAASLATFALHDRARAASPPLQIVATTGMIADAAARVGGAAVAVQALMGAGVDPHAYRQTRSDIRALTQADLVLWHGLYLEAQMEAFLEDLARRVRTIAVTDRLLQEALLAHEEYAGRFDPHVWMSPPLWSQIVIRIGDALSDARPEAAQAVSARTAAYLEEIAALETYSRDVLASVPEGSRVLLSAHDAFGYFGAAYGFEVIGIQGISTESEAGLARIASLVELIVARDIRAVFVETSVSDRNIRALIEGADAKGHRVAIGGSLFSDAMGAPDSYEGTYLGMIDHNVTTIARALGGLAPAKGRLGRLSLQEKQG